MTWNLKKLIHSSCAEPAAGAGCTRVSQICLSASCLSVSLRLYFLEGTGHRRCFLPSASK